VHRHQGAEIRTEGDSFYVVLPTASLAVQCGLDIVAAARQAAEASWTAPIRVGVGVHAGEAIPRPEGPVGTAINMAARLCALAAPGEVLVSDTVRSLTRSILPVNYASRGRRRLKGVAEPVEVFRALPAGESADSPSRPWRAVWLVAAAVVLLVLLLVAAFALGVLRLR
jgi:adenylate cyclase